MSDLIKIKSGSLEKRTKMPNLSECELGYIKDKKELHIGTPDGNVRLCGESDVARIKALEDKTEPAGVFYAIYGETTGEQINQAYQEGKIIACKIPGGKVLYLTVDWMSGNRFTFSATDYLQVTSVEVSGDGWSGISVQLLVTKEYVDGLIQTVNDRIDALTAPSE